MNRIEQLVRKIKGDNDYTIPLSTVDFQIWNSWYRGNVDKVHNRQIWNGKNYIKTRLKTLQMAKKVCEDWANLIMNEKCDIILPDETANETFSGILYDTDFWVKANESVEKSYALGLGALVLSVNGIEVGDKGTVKFDKGKLSIDFVDRYKLVPLVIEDNKIKEIAFLFDGSEVKTYIIHTRVNDGVYVINSFKYNKRKNKVIEEYEFNTKSTVPWFQIIRPFISNNDIAQGFDEGLGMSVFANSLDTLHAIDNKYDSFDNEFIAGRKKLHVSDEAWAVHNKKDGSQEKVFNPMDSIYYQLPGGEGKNLLTDVSGPLRAADHITALNAEFNILSSKVGLGESYYKFNGSGATPTATQVISENSALFKTLKKHQILIEAALRNLTIAAIAASVNFTKNPILLSEDKYKDIVIDFDDSIIEDKGAEMERDKSLVIAGLMSPVEFRERWMGEDYDLAVENYRKYFKHDIINKYMPAVAQGLMTPAQFVLEVYGKPDAVLEQYIEDNKQQGGNFDDFASLYEGD